MAVKIQLRRDTAANWNSNNPILAEGEIGIELDTNRMKVGDGSTHWNDLSYAFEDYYIKTGETVANADKVDNFDASQTPQASQIPVLNSSGQLWLPFAQTSILVNGQDMMSRTFYVDAENGDDNNDGSESVPFKTIAKACDSVPVGGKGVIYIPRGQTLHINSDIELFQKYIQITPYGSGDDPTIEFNTYVDTNYAISGSPQNNFSYGFVLYNSLLYFYSCILQNASKADVSLDWGTLWGRRTPIYSYDLNCFSFMFKDCTINQTRDYFVGGYADFIQAYINKSNVNFSEDAVALITAVDGGGLLFVRQTSATSNYKWIDPGTIGQNVITNLSSLNT